MFGLSRKCWTRLPGSAIPAWMRSAFLASSQQQILLGCLVFSLIYQTTNKSSDVPASLESRVADARAHQRRSGGRLCPLKSLRYCHWDWPSSRVQQEVQAYASAAATVRADRVFPKKGAQASKGLKTCKKYYILSNHYYGQDIQAQ